MEITTRIRVGSRELEVLDLGVACTCASGNRRSNIAPYRGDIGLDQHGATYAKNEGVRIFRAKMLKEGLIGSCELSWSGLRAPAIIVGAEVNNDDFGLPGKIPQMAFIG